MYLHNAYEKFKSAYKTIELSNMSNFSVGNNGIKIRDYNYDNVEIFIGYNGCNINCGLITDLHITKLANLQDDIKINFDNIITLYTDNITNEAQTFSTSSADDLPPTVPSKGYYKTNNDDGLAFSFLTSVISGATGQNPNVKNAYIEAYYTNDLKLKIRFSKVIRPYLSSNTPGRPNIGVNTSFSININDSTILWLTNNSTDPVKITIKPRYK